MNEAKAPLGYVVMKAEIRDKHGKLKGYMKIDGPTGMTPEEVGKAFGHPVEVVHGGTDKHASHTDQHRP